jgi:hypothetical protein
VEQKELKEFVTQSLTDIIEGVSDAQKPAEDKGAIVNPAIRYSSDMLADDDSYVVDIEDKYYSAQMVDFDVEITVGVKSEMARIKFSVPVVFPYQE